MDTTTGRHLTSTGWDVHVHHVVASPTSEHVDGVSCAEVRPLPRPSVTIRDVTFGEREEC